jgi:hypothetical protein
LKYDLKRLVNAKWALITKKNALDKEAKLCKSFLKLMDVEWEERVTRLARNVLLQRKLQERSELPSPEDIKALTEYLVKKINGIELIPENFMKVVMLIQTRLLLYNKRRAGEIDGIKIRSAINRTKGVGDLDSSLTADLTKVEEYLLKSQEMITVRGKRNRPVPVILPADCIKPLDFLVLAENRQGAGIEHSNDYLFPTTGKYCVRVYDSLKKLCTNLSLKAPSRITSINLRKYIWQH